MPHASDKEPRTQFYLPFGTINIAYTSPIHCLYNRYTITIRICIPDVWRLYTDGTGIVCPELTVP